MTLTLTDPILPEKEVSSGSSAVASVLKLVGTPVREAPYEGVERINMWRAGENTSWCSPEIISDSTFVDSEQIFDVISSFYLSKNEPRDQQIANRLNTLYQDTLMEDERVLSVSLRQFTEFFLTHPDLNLPRITLTPDGTLRVRWLQGAGNFTAIEFIGGRVVKLVAEIPRESGETAKYFGIELIGKIRSVVETIGASFK